jgi:Ca-activated chloride channel family protein
MRPSTKNLVRRCAPAAAAAGLLGMVVLAQGAGPAVKFTTPSDGDYVSGPFTITVRLDPPATPVTGVSIFADGRLVCTLERPPFECPWDAGPKVEEHSLRAVATLADGRRIAQAIRTKGVGYAENVDVDVVQVTATVTDADGKFARGLRRQDFRVFEDGVAQEISAFAAENVPLEIIVAVDVSGSMTDAMAKVQESVKRFLSALRPADRVTVLGFNDNIFTVARPTVDLATRLAAVDRLAPWGGTALYDVIVQAFDQLGRQTGRRALVVFTDGEDLNSRIPIEVAERRLEVSDAVLYPLGMGRAPDLRALRDVLERLARKSGGRAFFGDRIEKLDDAFGEIIKELSNQYLLGYVPKDGRRDGRWRAIKVDLPGKDLRVRARQGYRTVQR